jgi:EAL domain-containing protein (putative c-di-GMP-specific phosphodiesterase class I)
VRPEELRDAVARAVDAKAAADRNRRAVRRMEEAKGAQLSAAASESDFRSALENVYLVYQPIVAPSQGRVLGYEALVRSRRARLSTARELVAAAEDFDAIQEFGRAIRSAVANAIDGLPRQALVFVNLHPKELLDDELFTSANPLKAHARRVVIELTEQARIEHVEERIERLRSLGFLFAVDDLGAGYAALTHLVRFEPDFAKIDLDLVRGVDENESKGMLVASLVHLCRALGVRLICEGVETQAEGRCLLDLGAELLQGYYFARPALSFDPGLREAIQGRIARLLTDESRRPLQVADSDARTRGGDRRHRGGAA